MNTIVNADYMTFEEQVADTIEKLPTLEDYLLIGKHKSDGPMAGHSFFSCTFGKEVDVANAFLNFFLACPDAIRPVAIAFMKATEALEKKYETE